MLELSALLRNDDFVCAASHSSICFCSRMLVWALFHAPFEEYRNSFRVRSFSFYDVWISLDVECFLNKTQMEITNDLIESADRMPECIRCVPQISLWFVGLYAVKRWGHWSKLENHFPVGWLELCYLWIDRNGMPLIHWWSFVSIQKSPVHCLQRWRTNKTTRPIQSYSSLQITQFY